MKTIIIAGTKNYIYAIRQCVQSIVNAASHWCDATLIFVTDKSKETTKAEVDILDIIPSEWKLHTIRLNLDDSANKYEVPSQIIIAKLQGAGFAYANKIKSNLCWVVESDTIVPSNSLKTLEWALNMPTSGDRSYYNIAAATYPNGMFLGGFGSYQHNIEEDFKIDEKIVPKRLRLLFDKCEDRLKTYTKNEPPTKELDRMDRLRKRLKECPPDGNIWEVTAKHGWRRRGWLDFAYPAIGEGALVPSDWCGLGCTLLDKEALRLADFNGYEGRGTQDLFLCWHRWHPAGLKIACLPHVPCDHIKRENDSLVHYVTYHERIGECKGHLRVRKQPFTPL
jgi:hypothetical protein